MDFLSLIKSLSAILSTSVILQTSKPVQAPPLPEPTPLVKEKKEPLVEIVGIKNAPQDIHSILFDSENNAFLLSFGEEGFLLSSLAFGSLTAEPLGSVKAKDIDRDSVSAVISPKNELFVTWIQKGQVHVAQWSEESRTFTGLGGSSTNITGSMEPYNLKPKVFFTSEGQLYLTWLFDPTQNIPENFHTKSAPHHDFYITTWTGKEWKKLDGTLWFERFSDSFPSSLSVYEYDLTFDEEQQPVVLWTRFPEEMGFEEDSQLYLTRYKPETGWQSLEDPKKVLSVFSFSNWIENPFITYQDDEFIIGWQSEKLNEEQIEPQVYTRKDNQWVSISPSQSSDTKRFALQKTPTRIILLDFRFNNLIARQYAQKRWTRFLTSHPSLSPHQTVFPLLPKARYFIDPNGPVLFIDRNRLWSFSAKKEL